MNPSSHGRWADERLPDRYWRPRVGLSPAERAEEQDGAAGGRSNRIVRRADGSEVLGSVFLRMTGGRRCYAYLRYSDISKTREVYIGEAKGSTRTDKLAAAWLDVRQRCLLDQRSS